MPPVLVLGGITGPILFAMVALICAELRPDYSHTSQFINELGGTSGPNAVLMNYAGFMVAGIFIFLSGVGLAGRLPRSASTVVGALLVALFRGRSSLGWRVFLRPGRFA